MRKITTLSTSVFIVSALLLSFNLRAASAGDIYISPLVVHIAPAEKDEPLVSDLNNSVVPGMDLNASAETFPALGLTYMWNEHWGVETYLTMPPAHDLHIKGLPGIDKAASVDILPLIVFAQYHYLIPESAVTLIGGMGAFYAMFNNLDASDDVKQLDPSIKFIADDTPGFAFQAGISYAINDKFHLRAHYTKMYLQVDLQIKTSIPTLGNLASTLTMDPELYMLGIGYKL